MSKGTLYLVTCGAPLASRAADGARYFQANEWDVVIFPTGASAPWIKAQDFGDTPIATDQRTPGDEKRFSAADAVVVAPATFNTLNSWANGNANTLALTTLCAALGARTMTVAVPFAKHDLAGHPAWLASLAVLRYSGVKLIDAHTGDDRMVTPITSGTGEAVANAFQWDWVSKHLTHASHDTPEST